MRDRKVFQKAGQPAGVLSLLAEGEQESREANTTQPASMQGSGPGPLWHLTLLTHFLG